MPVFEKAPPPIRPGCAWDCDLPSSLWQLSALGALGKTPPRSSSHSSTPRCLAITADGLQQPHARCIQEVVAVSSSREMPARERRRRPSSGPETRDGQAICHGTPALASPRGRPRKDSGRRTPHALAVFPRLRLLVHGVSVASDVRRLVSERMGASCPFAFGCWREACSRCAQPRSQRAAGRCRFASWY